MAPEVERPPDGPVDRRAVVAGWHQSLPLLLSAIPTLAISLLAASPEEATSDSIALVLVVCAGAAAAAWAWKSGRTIAAAHLFCWSFLAAAVGAFWMFGGVRTASGVTLITAVAVSAALLGRAAGVFASCVAVVMVALSGWQSAASEGRLPPMPSVALSTATVLANVVAMTLLVLLGGDLLGRAVRGAREAARRDPVTGLLGPEGFRAELEGLTALANGGGGAHPVVVLLALDGFDLVREAWGPTVSDQVLRAFAGHLRGVVGAGSVVGRMEGATFGLLLQHAWNAAELQMAGVALKTQLDRQVLPEAVKLAVYTRIGLARAPEGRVTADDQLAHAAAALTAAERCATVGVRVYEPALTQRAARTLDLDSKLAEAVTLGHLVPYFQPIVRLGDGQLEGFEALVRWCPPDRPPIPPGDFLPRAEETGLIVQIDRAVLRLACEQIAAWDAELGPSDLWVSVNLSALQFQVPGLPECLKSSLSATGVDAARLHLEVTESALTEDVEATRAILQSLQSLGVTVLLDDFGTGWSSLKYVQSYAVDIVKIDRSFVSTIHAQGGAELAATVTFMARALGIGVIAEGVETEEQRARLAELGVELGQGYLWSRPLPARQATELVREASAFEAPSPDHPPQP